MTAKMDEHIETVIEDPRWDLIDLEKCSQDAASAVFERLSLLNSQLSVVVLGASDARIATLNADFRGKPQPTNVLSWPSQERSADKDGGHPPSLKHDAQEIYELGDIALAYETCEAEANAQNKPVADHVRHLLVHGILHLLGYDHIRDGDAALMERLEIEILANMGIEDPYV